MWEKCSRKEVWLSDIRFLCHVNPKDALQEFVYKISVENTLEPLPSVEAVLPVGNGKRGNLRQAPAASPDKQTSSLRNAIACHASIAKREFREVCHL